MTRISCDVVHDLLPLYYDEICSRATTEVVKEHLADCTNCRSSLEQLISSLSIPLQDMEINKLEGNGLRSIKRLWSRAQTRAYLKGLLGAASISAILFLGYFGLFRWNFIPVSSDHIIISNIRSEASGEIAFRVQINNGYSFNHVKHTTNDDGSFFITPVSPIIRTKDDIASNLTSGEVYVNPVSVRASQKTHGNDVEITSIYYGSPDDPILIWKKGMKIPAATQ